MVMSYVECLFSVCKILVMFSDRFFFFFLSRLLQPEADIKLRKVFFSFF